VAAESGRESTHAKLRAVRQKQSRAARAPAAESVSAAG